LAWLTCRREDTQNVRMAVQPRSTLLSCWMHGEHTAFLVHAWEIALRLQQGCPAAGRHAHMSGTRRQLRV
jgi:hypothetical protein